MIDLLCSNWLAGKFRSFLFLAQHIGIERLIDTIENGWFGWTRLVDENATELYWNSLFQMTMPDAAVAADQD